MNDIFHVAHMTPVLHYTMGGLEIDAESRVLGAGAKPIPGLFAAGEVAGGVHGANRLGGSSLLGCVVFGRVSGDSASAYLLQQTAAVAGQGGRAAERLGAVAGHVGGKSEPATKDAQEEKKASSSGAPQKKAGAYTMEDVAKHNKKDDCWVVVDGQVLDVTSVSTILNLIIDDVDGYFCSSCPTTLEERKRSSFTLAETQLRSSTCFTTRRWADVHHT